MFDTRTVGKFLAYPIAILGMYLVGFFIPGNGWTVPALSSLMWFSICHITGLALISSTYNEKQEKYLYFLQKQRRTTDDHLD